MFVLFFQQGSPFKALRYRIIGDDNAPAFFKIDERSGEITINRDLKETDNEVFYVCTMQNLNLK